MRLPVHFFWLFLLMLLGCAAPEDVLPTQAVLPTVNSPVATVRPTDPPTPPPPSPTATASARPTLTAALSATATASPTLTLTPTPSPTLPPLEIDFEAVYSLMVELREPLRQALEADQSLLYPAYRFTVTAFRERDGWAKITLAPTELVENGWQRVEDYRDRWVEVLARQTDDRWQMWLMGSADNPPVPGNFVNLEATPPPLAGGYRFPWRAGQSWWSIQGWHEGNALDFQPQPEGSHAVLAAESGLLKEVCSDGYQSLLQITHADGRATYYLHVTLGQRVRERWLDQPVPQGLVLGQLYRRVRYRTACGQGYSRHLHFAVSDRSLTIDGYLLADIAAVASCCTRPPSFTSTNQPVSPE